MHIVILCGGSGTRLWPLSRKNFPKQFLNLCGDKSLLQETFARARKIAPTENIVLTTNKANYFNVVNQIREIEKNFDSRQILTEPAALGTLPAVLYAVKYLLERKKINPDDSVAVLPSDHYIKEEGEYCRTLKRAMENVGDRMGTIGVLPTRPETGYGYIKKGKKENDWFRKVDEFIEKPDAEAAIIYVHTGQYLWNSGIYVFTPRTFANELKKHAPEAHSLFLREPKEFMENFSALPPTSIDSAISEKSDKMSVMEGDFGWSDIGSFDSLAEVAGGKNRAKHVSLDSKNIFAYSANNRLIATSGVEDLIIVENSDSILVQKKGKSNDIRKIVEHLDKNDYDEAEHNIIVHRPWGKYEVLIEEPGVKAKKITVYPGAKLSLQYHYHRAEHWVVVRGTAKVINGEREIFLRENESTFIPAMSKHRLENPGKTNLEIIEVQTGRYTEEDDIVRLDDEYDR